MTAGPLLGGLLAAAGALELALLLDAASFVAVAACARALHARRDPRALARAAGDTAGCATARATSRATASCA